MRCSPRTSFAWLGVMLALCAPSGLWAQDSEGPTPLYVIQPSDILEVFVWKEPDLSRRVLVRPDGRISFPLVQDLQAAGLTPAELKEKIEGLLKQFIASPNVTVIVEEIRNYRIYVTGKVNNPGSFTLEKPVTVLQALSLAGGFAEFASESDVKVVRTYGDQYMYLDFNYKDVIKGKNTEQNIVLRSGDVVVVP
ncbi:MAG TPA: polysaccharide biosynthesis/export family protein [Acidobacteriota bacterium]|nr:polysaccharide biosynthesis/export family protein [Acidobacteriota bacterium]HRR26138.1 polysaccharide biosynthesis/export family protein [Acidobacteriota bacterium]